MNETDIWHAEKATRALTQEGYAMTPEGLRALCARLAEGLPLQLAIFQARNLVTEQDGAKILSGNGEVALLLHRIEARCSLELRGEWLKKILWAARLNDTDTWPAAAWLLAWRFPEEFGRLVPTGIPFPVERTTDQEGKGECWIEG